MCFPDKDDFFESLFVEELKTLSAASGFHALSDLLSEDLAYDRLAVLLDCSPDLELFKVRTLVFAVAVGDQEVAKGAVFINTLD